MTTRRAFLAALFAAAVSPAVALRLAHAPAYALLSRTLTVTLPVGAPDYEEGVWQPSLRFGGPVYYATASGWYTRVGNFVHIHARLELRA